MPTKDRKAIAAKLEAYAEGKPQNVIDLKGSPFKRLRHGNWRAVFEETGEVILVLDIAHRREIYR